MKEKYILYFTNKKFLISLSISIILIILSLFINYYANIYAAESFSNPVTDIILSNTRVYDVDTIFIYGPLFVGIYILFLCLKEPRRLPFVIKVSAFFVIVRSIFISLTHIGPFPTHLIIDPASFMNIFTLGPDLFFSGHTGFPFLMAIIFWENIYTRIFLIASSILFGIVVLMAHLHYSIDVFAAFFIADSIFHISETIFNKDYKMFLYGLEPK